MSSTRVLITGAGSGLGAALAQRYARRGARVACIDIDEARAQATREGLPGTGHLALAADVGSDAAMETLSETVHAAWAGVDVLVNNAGIASGGPMVETSMAEWQRVLDINLLGVVRGCRAFVPGMVARGHGHVVNTASFAGLAGAPNIMSYGVSKAAVVALSEQLRAELHPHGVAVSVLCPAFFQTNLLQSWQGPEGMRRFAEKMMAGSLDTLDSVADATFTALERRQFLVLPTRSEPMRWRLKRWLPDFYFKKLLQLSRQRT